MHEGGMMYEGGRLARLVYLRQAHLAFPNGVGCVEVMQPSSVQMTSINLNLDHGFITWCTHLCCHEIVMVEN